MPPNVCGATQWFLALRKISFASGQRTNSRQKPLSDNYNPFQMMERPCAAC
jgi:hypothetical protein